MIGSLQLRLETLQVDSSPAPNTLRSLQRDAEVEVPVKKRFAPNAATAYGVALVAVLISAVGTLTSLSHGDDIELLTKVLVQEQAINRRQELTILQLKARLPELDPDFPLGDYIQQ